MNRYEQLTNNELPMGLHGFCEKCGQAREEISFHSLNALLNEHDNSAISYENQKEYDSTLVACINCRDYKSCKVQYEKA